jgi:RHS repeat-associated protein
LEAGPFVKSQLILRNIPPQNTFTDQVGSPTTFTYDKRNLLTGKTDPLSKSTVFTYYNDGSLWTKTDRNGATITYSYTPSGKLASIAYPGGSSVGFTYNTLDQLTAMVDGIGTTGYTYDAAGRLATLTNPYGLAVGYTYDAAGNLSEMVYPGNKKVVYSYDAVNRMKTATIDWLPGKPLATYIYDDAGRMTGITNFNGIATTYGYDAANRLASITSPVASYGYTLDGNGNRTNETRTEPLPVTNVASTTAYGYNAKGDRLLTAGAASFGYDNEGQLASGYGTSYTFDYEHRLTAMTGASYAYDGNGNRLQAIRGGVTTRYIYDAAGNLLAEADANNVITRYYVYGAGLLATVTPTDQVYCYHFNPIGSTVAMTDQSQAMVNKYAYDTYGNIGNQVEAIPQPFKYVGQYGVMAEPNGFYYMKARYYDPKVGRFISEDPIGFDGGDVNLMAYVRNNPIMGIDPRGLDQFLPSSYLINPVTQHAPSQQVLQDINKQATIFAVGTALGGLEPATIASAGIALGSKSIEIFLYSDHPNLDFAGESAKMLIGSRINPAASIISDPLIDKRLEKYKGTCR